MRQRCKKQDDDTQCCWPSGGYSHEEKECKACNVKVALRTEQLHVQHDLGLGVILQITLVYGRGEAAHVSDAICAKRQTLTVNYKVKTSSYITQYPVLRTVQSALHFTSLADLFTQTPSQLLWEASSHMLQLMRDGCS